MDTTDVKGIRADLAFLKNIITNSKATISNYRSIFTIWGLINLVGGIGSFILILNSLAAYIPLIWLPGIASGLVFSIILGRIKSRQFKVNPFLIKILATLWICSVAGIVIFAGAAVLFHNFDARYIPGFSFIVLGIAMCPTAVLFEAKSGFIMGLLSFAAAITSFLFPFYSMLIQGIIMGGGFLFFGIKRHV